MRWSDYIKKTDNNLWHDLITAFKEAFTNTGKVEQARMDLDKLEIEGNLINEYIAKFENLLHKAEISQTKVRSLQKFKDGLWKGILSSIFWWDTWPKTINEWQGQARREVHHLGIIRESLGKRGNFHLSTKQARWRILAQQIKIPKSKRDKAVSMDINARIMQPRTLV
jgi:Retrotransposon gag protein